MQLSEIAAVYEAETLGEASCSPMVGIWRP